MGDGHPPSGLLQAAGLEVLPGEVRPREGRAWLVVWQERLAVLRQSPPAATPVLTGLGAWTSDGRTLAIGQETIQPDGTIRNTPTTMYMLDTAAPGSKLPTTRAITLRDSHDFRAFTPRRQHADQRT